MCNFASGIITQAGDIIESDYTDQHELIIEANGLKELALPGHNSFIRYEYTGTNPFDIDTYTLKIDEDSIPVWFDNAMRDRLTEEIKTRTRKRILTTGNISLLLGGKWILGGDVKVDRILNAFIPYVGGSASIDTVRGSASIDTVGGSAHIDTVGDSAHINTVGGSARIDTVWGSASIKNDWR